MRQQGVSGNTLTDYHGQGEAAMISEKRLSHTAENSGNHEGKVVAMAKQLPQQNRADAETNYRR